MTIAGYMGRRLFYRGLSKSASMPNQRVLLMKEEGSFDYMIMEGTTTITFFTGDLTQAYSNLRERMRSVLTLNPWLAGRLVSANRRVHLDFTSDITEKELDAVVVMETRPSYIAFPSTPYAHIVKRLSQGGHYIHSGYSVLNTTTPVCRLTCMSNGDTSFAVVFSLAHSVGDGYTYYRILRMLSENEPIVAMRVHRDHEFKAKKMRAMGNNGEYFASIPIMLNMISTALFKRSVTMAMYAIDEGKVAVAKTEAISDDCPFVSTNDILTTRFMTACHLRSVLMVVNARGRLHGFDTNMPGNQSNTAGNESNMAGNQSNMAGNQSNMAGNQSNMAGNQSNMAGNESNMAGNQSNMAGNESNMAGNYLTDMTLDALVCKTPSHLRHILTNGPPYSTGAELPQTLTSLTSSLGLITNWAGFFDRLDIINCKQIIHLPVQNYITLPFDLCILFKSHPDKTAVLLFTRTKHVKEACEHLLLDTTSQLM